MARKRSAPLSNGDVAPPPPKRRSSARNIATATAATTLNPDVNRDVIDAPNATRASPDGGINEDIVPGPVKRENGIDGDGLLKEVPEVVEPLEKKKRGRGKNEAAVKSEDMAPLKKGRGKKAARESGVEDGSTVTAVKEVKQETDAQDNGPEARSTATPAKKVKKETDAEAEDPEAEGDEEANEEEVKKASTRPPPVNSDYLPLPWKGRLGFACLNTYLRNSNPPVFSSRTCRIQSILEHRHPLQDPSQPEHPTKNRPDRNKPADMALGQRYVESLCLANIKDIEKMIRWNDRYNIKFMRLSSEMFPFASHPEYGYKLAPFASEALASAGKIIAELGHRVTTHPGQFTQLGSPRKPVIENAIRDLDYHDEMLTLLKLPQQENRDAVMILHMGGLFEGKTETLQRFRENYANLSPSVKNRLVLENDDVIWSVHDLLPVCEELNIPFVLDFHHHNIIFDSNRIREGTKDIMDLFPRILATWKRKNITPKMHYSEPTPQAITGRQRRKHSPRVATLPPCPPDMDLMIEAKDKEQAVFELMRIFKLPGYDTFNDVLPYVRNDDNKIALQNLNRTKNKKKKTAAEEEEENEVVLILDEDVGMGGPEGRVYWPPTMEEWLRPKKREVKKKEVPAEEKGKGKAKEDKKAKAAELYAAREAEKVKGKKGSAGAVEEDSDVDATPATKKAKAAMKKRDAEKAAAATAATMAAEVKDAGKKPRGRGKGKKEKEVPAVPTPESSEEDMEVELHDDQEEMDEDDLPITPVKRGARRGGGRSVKGKISYAEAEDGDESL